MNFNIFVLGSMKKFLTIVITGNVGHFEIEIDMAGFDKGDEHRMMLIRNTWIRVLPLSSERCLVSDLVWRAQICLAGTLRLPEPLMLQLRFLTVTLAGGACTGSPWPLGHFLAS